jgi:hypothetical protein
MARSDILVIISLPEKQRSPKRRPLAKEGPFERTVMRLAGPGPELNKRFQARRQTAGKDPIPLGLA